MVTKQLINKCLYLLNKHCSYNNVSYGVHNYISYISVAIYIWDDFEKFNSEIIKSFNEIIHNDEDFNELEDKIVNFIKENKEIIIETADNLKF